jgi:hypothetical protein
MMGLGTAIPVLLLSMLVQEPIDDFTRIVCMVLLLKVIGDLLHDFVMKPPSKVLSGNAYNNKETI